MPLKIYVYAYISVHRYICAHTQRRYIYIYIYIYVCVCVCIYIRVLCVYVWYILICTQKTWGLHGQLAPVGDSLTQKTGIKQNQNNLSKQFLQ